MEVERLAPLSGCSGAPALRYGAGDGSQGEQVGAAVATGRAAPAWRRERGPIGLYALRGADGRAGGSGEPISRVQQAAAPVRRHRLRHFPLHEPARADNHAARPRPTRSMDLPATTPRVTRAAGIRLVASRRLGPRQRNGSKGDRVTPASVGSHGAVVWSGSCSAFQLLQMSRWTGR